MSNVDEYVRKGTLWSGLPAQVQTALNRDEAEYNARALVYFLQNQLEYSGELIKNIVRSERAYYRQLIQYSSQQMMLFPYHLQRKIVAGLKITPFEYYRTIVHRTMLSESSYDRIPNFTAADAYQILGIGRNEYIDLLNAYKGIVCSQQSNLNETHAAALDGLLPQHPLNCKHLDPWFIVRAGYISVDDVKSQTAEEQAFLDKVIDNDNVSDAGNAHQGLRVSDIPIGIFHQLYRRGLIYVDVPICETDCFSVPTLDGFIMNRVSGDSCETMLYKIFISLDPQSCVRQLATDLGVGLEFVLNATSVFCRLGFAHKVSVAPQPNLSAQTGPNVSLLSELTAAAASTDRKRTAFIFDATITAYLMLGNLSSDLKNHSVTMFEVGKLTGVSLSAFYRQLSEVSHSSEQDVGVYYEHAKCLSQTIQHITGKSAAEIGDTDLQSLDLIRCGSLGSLEPATRSRILSKNYSLLVCMAPLSYEESQVISDDWPLMLGPPVAEASSPWFRFFTANIAGSDYDEKVPSFPMPTLLLCRGSRVSRLPKPLTKYSRFLITSWGHESVLMDIYTLFNSINDLTMNSPVLIQAYDDREHTAPLHQHFLPLPLSKEFLATNVSRLPWLENLAKSIDLTSLIGYLSVLLPDGQSAIDLEAESNGCATNELGVGSSYHPSASQFLEQSIIDPRVVLSETDFSAIVSAGRSVCLLNLHLGVPLFNAVLNDAVFAKLGVGEADLLGQGVRQRLAKANTSLRSRLTQFIKATGGVYVCNPSMTANGQSEAPERKSLAPNWPLPSKTFCWSVAERLALWDN